jgi:hypothetical protein
MFTLRSGDDHPRGQIIVLAAFVMSLVVFAVGLVIDGGTGLAQRRAAQNASDFGALAGARIVAQRIGGDTVNGTDALVQQAITNAVVANGGMAPTFGAPDGPQYINDDGDLLGYVGAGMPTDAAGVQVTSEREWKPFFLGFFGFDQLSTSADATAKGGFSLAGPPAGTVFPAGIALSFFTVHPVPCGGEISADPTDPCYPQNLTPGNLNVPGGFGWLTFGADRHCTGFGLGMIVDGCDQNTPFLNGEIGPPGNSYGCCTAVSGTFDLDRIGSLPGNKASADCSYYVDNEITVTVPIWDVAGGTGANGWYHIVGFAGFQITDCPGAKNLEGVWRLPMWGGPVSSTPTGTPGVPQALGVQLVQ